MKKLEDYDEVISPSGKKINMKKLLKDQLMAKAMLNNKFEFFSLLVDNLRPIYTFEIPTQATDGVRLLVNPEFTDSLDMQSKVFVMAHEVMHCALNHMERGRNHDHRLSNIAADYEVNGLLARDGVMDGPTITGKIHGLWDAKYDGMAYEHIYALQPKGGSDQHQTGSNQQDQGQQGQDRGQQGQQGQSGNQGQSGDGSGNGGQDQKPQSPDFVDGWNKALEDYKAGKLKF